MAVVGFIGVGNMGGPMAANLVKGGHKVLAFDLSDEAVAKVVASGGNAAESVAEAVEGADIVVSMLPAGAHVLSVYEKEVLPNALGSALLIDCSTIDVDTSRKVHGLATAQGLAMVDAPVSGGIMGAEAGTLAFMCGGAEDAFARAEPVLQLMGKTIVHAGGAGAGQAAKICNNMMLGIQMISVCEAFALADRLGLDRQKLFDISSSASGQCWSLTTYCPVPGPVPTSPANRDYAAGFAAAMMLKDLKLAQDAASSCDAITPLGAAAETLYSAMVEGGEGAVDFSGIIKQFQK